MKTIILYITFIALGAITISGRTAPIEGELALKSAFKNIEHKFVESNVRSETHFIRNKDDLNKFWNRFSKSPLPKIDFTKYDVIIYLMGTQGSSGYAVMYGNDNSIILCKPSSEPQLAEVTSPYLVKVVPKTKGHTEMKFRSEITGTENCK